MNQITIPSSVATIEISSICNAKCRWCTTGIQNRVCTQKAQFITPELFERGLNRLLKFGWITKGTIIELYNWGEPFLNAQLNGILEVLWNKELCFRLSTNGLIYRKLQPSYIKNLEYLMVSLPGMSQDSYDKIHQLDMKRVHENIKKFAQDLAECGVPEKLLLNFHVYQFNISEIEEARYFAESLGAVFCPNVAYFADYKLCQDFLTGEIGYQDLRDASMQLFMDIYCPQNIDVDYKCFLWNQVCFDHEFNLVPCCRLTTAEQLGNLFTDNPDELLKAREKFSTCRECITSGQSNIILHGTQPKWYTDTLLPKLSHMPRPHIYYDTGTGFSEKHTLYDNAGKISQTCFTCNFELPEKVQSLRFDPIEGNKCLIRNLRITNEKGYPLAYLPINGKALSGGELLFHSTDPQISILFKKAPQRIHIESDIDLIM